MSSELPSGRDERTPRSSSCHAALFRRPRNGKGSVTGDNNDMRLRGRACSGDGGWGGDWEREYEGEHSPPGRSDVVLLLTIRRLPLLTPSSLSTSAQSSVSASSLIIMSTGSTFGGGAPEREAAEGGGSKSAQGDGGNATTNQVHVSGAVGGGALARSWVAEVLVPGVMTGLFMLLSLT